MKKTLGILVLLVVICLITWYQNPVFLKPFNVSNLLNRTGLFGVIAIGVSFVIITGGIDLSIGSVVCLTGCLLPYLLFEHEWGVIPALIAVAFVSVMLGLIHGLLITKLNIQPFIVTLCGLLIYRGVARWFTADDTMGFKNEFETLKLLVTWKMPLFAKYQIPITLLIMLGLAVVAGVFLNQTIYGRYLFALGRNEQAAKYSGINTDNMKIMAYIICSATAGLGGVMFALDLNSIQPAGAGNFYELYAISAAVLGGCSLRGGEGTILGVVIGTAVMRVLRNSIGLIGIDDRLEFTIIGVVLLIGVIVDEIVKRYAAKRRASIEAKSSG